MPDRSAFITVPEAASALRVSSETIRRMIRAGELSGTRVGRQYRVLASAVQAIVNRAQSGG